MFVLLNWWQKVLVVITLAKYLCLPTLVLFFLSWVQLAIGRRRAIYFLLLDARYVDWWRQILKNFIGIDEVSHLLLKIHLRSATSQSEVTEASSAVVVNEDVGRLDISMHDIGRVQIVNRAEDIIHDYFDVLISEVKVLKVAEKLSKICFFRVHYNEQVLYWLIRLWINVWDDDVMNPGSEAVGLLFG